MVKVTATKTEQPRAGWRFRLGLTILIVGWLSPSAHSRHNQDFACD